MTKSDLIEKLTGQYEHISAKIIEHTVKNIIEHMIHALSQGKRIEIRGFGSFSLHYRMPRIGRNPKTGEKIYLNGKYVPYFKPGKALKKRVNIYNLSN
ncbi:MAG: integration host factor subunit beta [Pantoea sp. Brub]|nr:integration host factor subunit beta [Pantoea sp. Brub]